MYATQRADASTPNAEETLTALLGSEAPGADTSSTFRVRVRVSEGEGGGEGEV